MRRFALGLALLVLAKPASAQQSCESEPLADEARVHCERGAADAVQHLSDGVPEWHWWGIPDHTTPVADSLLRERYGLRPVFRGDVVWDHEGHYTDAYNAVVHDRLAARFGSDFITRAYAEVASLFPGLDVLNAGVLRDVEAPPGACVGAEQCLAFVRFEITPAGVPSNLRVVRSSSEALNESALAAAARVRFQPAEDIENGRKLEGYAVPIRFANE